MGGWSIGAVKRMLSEITYRLLHREVFWLIRLSKAGPTPAGDGLGKPSRWKRAVSIEESPAAANAGAGLRAVVERRKGRGLVKPLSPSPRGWQSRPSGAETDNRKAQARSLSSARGYHPSLPA